MHTLLIRYMLAVFCRQGDHYPGRHVWQQHKHTMQVSNGISTFLRGTAYKSCLDLAFIIKHLSSSATWCADIDEAYCYFIQIRLIVLWLDILSTCCSC